MDTQQLTYLRMATTAVGLLALFALETARPFFRDRFARFRHGGRNLALGALNGMVVALLFAGPLSAAAGRARANRFGLMHWLDLPPGAALVVSIVLFDGWMYAWHRANHRVGLLWRFHRMHHTDRELDVTTALRFHTGEIAISSTLRAAVLVLLGMSFRWLIFYEIALLPVIQFHHSNVRIPYGLDRVMRGLLVSPGMHRLHHSVLRREHDGNYASIFSFWDRLFGSYRRRGQEGMRRLKIGLRRFPQPRWQTLWGMLRTPLR